MDSIGYENSFVAETYDFVGRYRSRKDREFFVEVAEQFGPSVLELGCGSGRILIPVARSGNVITGLDASEAMLRVCQTNLAKEGQEVRSRVQLVKGRMQDFNLKKQFHLVTMPFRPFQQLLTVGDQMSCLRHVYAHLRPGGRIILDLFNPWIHRLIDVNGTEHGQEPEFMMPDGRRIIRRHRTVSRDLFNQIIDEELIYDVTHPDASTHRVVVPFRMRYLHRFEAEHLLSRCGFELENVYADYDRTAYGQKYPGELIMIGKRVN